MDTGEKEKTNVGELERKFSIIGAGALLVYAIKNGSLRSLLAAALGAELVYRGVTGKCPVYKILDIDTSETDAFETLSRQASEPEKNVASEPDVSVQPPAVPKTAKKTAPEKSTAPKKPKLEEWSIEDLYEAAKKHKIPGRSKMKKAELVKALKPVV